MPLLLEVDAAQRAAPSLRPTPRPKKPVYRYLMRHRASGDVLVAASVKCLVLAFEQMSRRPLEEHLEVVVKRVYNQQKTHERWWAVAPIAAEGWDLERIEARLCDSRLASLYAGVRRQQATMHVFDSPDLYRGLIFKTARYPPVPGRADGRALKAAKADGALKAAKVDPARKAANPAVPANREKITAPPAQTAKMPPKRNGWTATDLAPSDPSYQGTVVEPNIDLGKFGVRVNTDTKVVDWVWFASTSTYANQDLGTRVVVKYPSNPYHLPTCDLALDEYAIRIFKREGSVLLHRGMHLMTKSDPAAQEWTFDLLASHVQETFPTLHQWRTGAIDNPFRPVRRPKREAFVKRPRAAEPVLPWPPAKAAKRAEAAPSAAPKAAAPSAVAVVPAPSEARAVPVVVPAAVPVAVPKPAPKTIARPAPQPLNRGARQMLRWIVQEAMSGEGLGLVGVDEMVEVAVRRVGPDARGHVELAFEAAGCVVATTTGGERMLTGPGLRLPRAPLHETTLPLEVQPGAGAGSPHFKSLVELEHYLFLSRFFVSVVYERMQIQYRDADGTGRLYTPDFYIPAIDSLERPVPGGKGGVFVESKAGPVSREELAKCAAVAAQGHEIILVNGYAADPIEDRRSAATSGGAAGKEWRQGMTITTFEAVGGRGRVKRRDNHWFYDEALGLPVVRPLVDIDDRGCSHPVLLDVYRDIAALER